MHRRQVIEWTPSRESIPHRRRDGRMEIEKTTVRAMLGRRGLKNRGMIEICQHTKTGEFVIVAAKGIRKKWLVFNLPEAMWRGRGSKEEVLEASKRLLEDKILAG
jgi:hypothetical protein